MRLVYILDGSDSSTLFLIVVRLFNDYEAESLLDPATRRARTCEDVTRFHVDRYCWAIDAIALKWG